MERRRHRRGALLHQRGRRTDIQIVAKLRSPERRQQDNVYEVTVRASDGDLMSTLEVEITVTNANESGVITGHTSVEYPENSTTTVATYSTNDPEGDDITWSVAGTDAARFSINENGELSFKSPPDYEAPNDANKDNVYEVTIQRLGRQSDVHPGRGSNRHGRQRIRRHQPAQRPSITQRTTPQPSPPTPSLTLTATASHGAWQARTQYASPSTRTVS